MSKKLFAQYYDWIDWSVYEGLSLEEQDELEEEHRRKFGLNHILKVDAPQSAVEAWEEDARRTREADKKGVIID